MKNKLSKILGVALSLGMLASMLVVGSPATAGTLAYTTETLPSLPSTTANAASFVDFAVSTDGNTIYGVVGTGTLYKSTNGGDSWVTRNIAGATPLTLVAVAPDDANIVAVANAAGPAVWISTNGAATGEADSWSTATGNLTLAAGITDLAISSAVSGVRQVAVSGMTAAPMPQIQSLNLGGTVAGWSTLSSGGILGAAATTRVVAIKFSPNYTSDRLLVAISNDSAAGNFINLFRFLTNSTGLWNGAAGFTDFTGATASTGRINAFAEQIVSADLSLAPTYTGTDSASRNAFVAINSQQAVNSGVWQIKDAVSKLISDPVMMRSVAFNGTNLVAGRADSNVTYRSSDPMASTPTFTTTTQFQRPSGGIGVTANNTQLAWAGANVVAATIGDESAFSRSRDNGATYQDISQWNTGIGIILEIAVSANASKVYMVTTNTTTEPAADVSVWSKTGTVWERLMSIVDPASLLYSLRAAPENANVLFLVQNNSQNIYFTDDGGDKNWVIRIANENIVDLAVESASVIYYATGLNVRKSTNGGFIWNDPAVAALTTGTPFALKSLGKDLLLLTTTGGIVSYSTNGGTTWTRPATITGAGSIQATAATLATGDYIYAAPGTPGGQIQRFRVGSVAPDNVWKAIGPVAATAGGTENFTGIALRGGILYAHSVDNTTAGAFNSRLWRSLNPAEAGETSVAFSMMFTGATLAASPDFVNVGVSPVIRGSNNLQISTSTAGNIIWGVDVDAAASEEAGDSTTAANDDVYSFTDTLAVAPSLSSPAVDAVIAANPISGGINSITLAWARPSLATAYQYEVALDDKFTQSVIAPTAVAPADPAITPVAITILPGAINPGTKYYWRIRATAPLFSPWTAARAFTTGSVEAPFAIKGPTTGDTNVGINPILSWSAYPAAKWYEVTLSEDPTFAIPEWSHNVTNLVYGVTETLKYGTTYYWRVRGVTADPFVQGTQVITPAGPWVVGAFTTMAEPVKDEPTVITVPAPAPPPQIITLPAPPPVVEKAAIPEWMLLTIIIIGAILVIALIVLIVRTRRVA